MKNLEQEGCLVKFMVFIPSFSLQNLKIHIKSISIGVGPVTVKIWWDVGYRTLQEVLDNAQLTSTVRLGIQLFPHFHQKLIE
jgi:hypothetical protein